MTSPLLIEELPAPLPAAWEQGRAQCVADETAWQPPTADLATLVAWVAQGLARITGTGPVPATGGQKQYAVDYEVIGFDTQKNPIWVRHQTQPFPCKNYDQCDAILQQHGFVISTQDDEHGVPRTTYSVKS